MLHYVALNRLYRDLKGKDEDFTKLWTTMPKEFCTLVQEMESLTSILDSYALGQAQLALVAASTTFYSRRICEKYSNMDKFQVMDLSTRPHLTSTTKDFYRIEKLISDFTELGKKCLSRLKKQLDIRFAYDSPYQFYPFFLDPVMCPMEMVIITPNYYEDVFQCFKVTHYLFYSKLPLLV
jgi:hypothetical protein